MQGALQKAVALELSFTESKLYDGPPQTGPSLPPMTVHSTTTQYKPSSNTTAQPKSSSTVQPPCKYCGDCHTPGMLHCPAAGKQCPRCGKLGHFAKVCLSGRHPGHQSSHANAVEDTDNAACGGDYLVEDIAYAVGAPTRSPYDMFPHHLAGHQCQA